MNSPKEFPGQPKAAATVKKSRLRPRRSMHALESRIVFDGAAVAAVDALAQAGSDVAIHPDAVAPVASARTEIVFIESNVADYQTLLNGVTPGAEVHVLDASRDGLAQMADILGGRSGIDAIHIVSHGSEGSLQLGGLNLYAQNLGDHAADLATIGGALDANADILLYGCSVAAGSDGAALVDALARATQADIAASTDMTGAAAKGGDWTLELSSGVIETASPLSAMVMDAFQGNLGVGDNDTFNMTTVSNYGTKVVTSAGTFGTLKVESTVLNLVDSVGTTGTAGEISTDFGTALNETSVKFSENAGKTFDFGSITITSWDENETLVLTTSKGGTLSLNDTAGSPVTFNHPGANSLFDGITWFTITENTTGETTNGYALTFDNVVLNNITAPGPTVTDANIAISGASGTGGAYKIGDTVTATWNNTAGGDNNAGVTGVTMDFSQFGGGAAVAASNSGGTWTATYTIVAGAIDGTNKNVSVTATIDPDGAGGQPGVSTTTADTTNAIVDNVAPTVSDGNIGISGASGTGGAYKIGDTVTATWNNTAGGDNNADTISGVTMDFSAFGGGAAVAASNSAGTWTATYTIVSGAIDGTNKNVSVTATDNAGNTTTTADTTNATLDNVAPTVTDANIAISGGSGTGGAFKIGDTVTATWNNSAGGDNNADTISGVTVDFSAFGGGAAVAASNSGGTWTATYTIVSGAIDGTNKNVSVTATDNAGNTTTTADTTNATLDNVAPTVSDARISISGASGTGGAYKIGDTVTATWNNTAGGDNNADTISGVTVDFSAFGGGAAVAASNSGGTWTATYTIVSGAIDGTNKNVSVTATDNAGNTTTTADTTNATLDNVAPTVTDGNISISGASGTGGAYKIGDTVTATWNNTAGGDNNADTISGVTVDFSAFGGGAAVAASNSGGTWTATYTIVSGAIDGTNKNVSVTATDNAGNTTTTADTTNATVDNQAPTVTDGNISISGGSGTGGAFKTGDTVTATWNNTAGGDNNADTISGVTVDFSAFGGGAAVAATNNAGTWTATYTLVTGAVNGTNMNVSVTATDNAGNAKTTADTSNATADTTAPTIANAVASQAVNDNATLSPFATMTFTEANTLTVQITLDTAAKGSFTTLNGFANAGGGVYTYTGTAANATTAIQGLVFTPTANRVAPGSTETTTFTVLATDAAGNATSNNTTTVVSTSINDAPVLAATGPAMSGLGINPAAPSNGTTTGSTLVSALVGGITDADSGAVKGIAVTATDTANGTLYYSTNGGTTWTAAGAVAANSALLLASDANTRLYYQSNNGVSGNIASALTFRAWDQSSDTAGSKVDTTTNGNATAFSTATDTASIAIYPPPTVGSVSAGQAVNDNATISPFSASTIANAGTGNNVTVTVALDTQAKGSFTTLSGFTDNGNGSYTLTNVTAGAAQTAIRGLVFTPTLNRVNPTLTETTTLTVTVTDVTTTVAATDTTTTVVSTSINDAPAVGGATAVTNINDTATATPFSAFTITDADTAQTQTLTVTLDAAAKGALSNLSGGSYNSGTGVYTFTGTAAQAQAAIRALVFTPTANRVNPTLTETTTFTVSVNDAIAAAATDATTTVVATSVNDAPTVGGATAVTNLNVGTTASTSPFAAFTVTDADTAQTQTVTVTLDTAAKGALSNLGGGAYDAGTGVYSFSGTAAQAQAAIRALTFTPTAGRVTQGNTETTTFTVSVNDGIAAAATDNTSTVVVTNVPAPAAPPPAAPSLSLSAASDSGTVGDGITNVVTPVISGTAAAGSTVTLYDTDGTTVLATTVATSGGTWTATSAALANGTHTLTAKAASAGGTSAASAGLSITIDNAAPAAPSLSLSAASDSGVVGDGITTVTTPVITGTAEAGSTVTLYDGATVVGTAVADAAGNWSITSSALAVGAHTLSARAADVTGNVSPSSAGLGLSIEAQPVVPPPVVTPPPVEPPPIVTPPPVTPPPVTPPPVTPPPVTPPPVTPPPVTPPPVTPPPPPPPAPPVPPAPPAPMPPIVAPVVAPPVVAPPPPVVPISVLPVPDLPSGTIPQSSLVVDNGIGNLSVGAGQSFTYVIPRDAFLSSSSDARLSFQATQANGAPLPNWLRFNPETGTFSGVVPEGVRGDLRIRVKAVDSKGNEAVTTFTLKSGVVARENGNQPEDGNPRENDEPRQRQRGALSGQGLLSVLGVPGFGLAPDAGIQSDAMAERSVGQGEAVAAQAAQSEADAHAPQLSSQLQREAQRFGHAKDATLRHLAAVEQARQLA